MPSAASSTNTTQQKPSPSSGPPIPIPSSPQEKEGFKLWNQSTSARGVLGVGAEMRGAWPLDRLGLRRPARPSASCHQQLAHPDLPWDERNLGSRARSLCTRRLVSDWPARFGHPLFLLETFVDPVRFPCRLEPCRCVPDTRQDVGPRPHGAALAIVVQPSPHAMRPDPTAPLSRRQRGDQAPQRFRVALAA